MERTNVRSFTSLILKKKSLLTKVLRNGHSISRGLIKRFGDVSVVRTLANKFQHLICFLLEAVTSIQKKVLGPILDVDKALFYALLSRSGQAFSGMVTLWLILYFMPPVEQGFYYTFTSVINLQIFFELGLSFVILQSTTHYFAFLQWSPCGEIIGDDSRIRQWFAFLHKTVLCYLIAAISFALLLTSFGLYFFSLKQEAVNFTWRYAWIFFVLGTSLNLYLAPFLAALEGSGKIIDIHRFRWKQFMLATSIAWLMLFLGYGLFMPAASTLTNAFVSFFWLLKTQKKFMLRVIKRPLKRESFSWLEEIWPLQWRVAVSWMSGYFINQAFIPVIFYYQGPVIAGKLGVCLNVMNMLSLFCLTWVNVRLPQMGRLVKQRDWPALDQLFIYIFWQSLLIFICSSCLLSLGVVLFRHSNLMARMLPWSQILILLLSMLFAHVTAALSLYLRAHKADPFMPFSVLGALLLATSSWYGAAQHGSLGVCISLLIVNGLYGLPSSVWLWRYCKRSWHVNGQQER